VLGRVAVHSTLKLEKRGKLQIYFDVLKLVCEELESNDRLCLTRIAHAVNLPYDRFQKSLESLVQLGMISRDGGKLGLTDKGFEYIYGYKKMTDFYRCMGLL